MDHFTCRLLSPHRNSGRETDTSTTIRHDRKADGKSQSARLLGFGPARKEEWTMKICEKHCQKCIKIFVSMLIVMVIATATIGAAAATAGTVLNDPPTTGIPTGVGWQSTHSGASVLML